MPDSKITALTALTAADPAVDMFPVVDVSDTTMAASGTTKRISINNILACSPTATLASATITGDLTVRTNKLAVTSTGVGFGTLSPNNTLTVRGTQDAGIEVNSADSNSSRLIFAYDPANTRWYINSTLSGSGTTLPLAFLIQNSEVARFNTTGNLAFANTKGIDFSASPNASGATSELLNDYEEGTFTPTVIGTTTAGTGTYTNQVGRYTKIGNLVTIQVYLSWTAHTGTGNMRFGNFPFNTASDAGSLSAAAIGYVNNIALTAGNILTAFTSVSNSFIAVYQTPVGGGASTEVPIDTSGDIVFTLTYRA